MSLASRCKPARVYKGVMKMDDQRERERHRAVVCFTPVDSFALNCRRAMQAPGKGLAVKQKPSIRKTIECVPQKCSDVGF